MTAAALLVVLGAALLMQVSGLSMAMGAFLAGALLSESSFRHELEADVDPFRGILLGLFFLGVGMSLDLPLMLRDWPVILGAPHAESLTRAALLARGVDVAIIESDIEMIRSAAEFGFKVYYGDGTRLDVLRTSGAAEAEALLVCVNDPAAADRIVALARSEFPMTKLHVRSFDRAHTIRLIAAGVDEQVRETFESALAFSALALQGLGVPAAEAAELVDDVRRRDAERLQLEIVGGSHAGKELLRGNGPKPTPFTVPKRAARALSEETAEVITQPAAAPEPAGS